MLLRTPFVHSNHVQLWTLHQRDKTFSLLKNRIICLYYKVASFLVDRFKVPVCDQDSDFENSVFGCVEAGSLQSD